MAGSIGTIKVRVGADINGLKRNLKSAEVRLKHFGRNVGGIADGINRNVTVPFAIAGAASVKMASDFEASMTKIVSQVGISREEVEKMKVGVLELSGRTARAPLELADAMFFVQSAGLRGAEAMDVLEMSAKAASAGFGETKTVADLVTSAMNAYGSANLSAAEATDVLAATVREGKAQATDLVAAMGPTLPMATAMGVKFNQLGAAIAGMTRTGTTAETAAVQLTQIMMTLSKPMAESEKVAAMLGTSFEELRARVGQEGLMPVLVDLRKRLDEAGIQVAELFREKRALAGVLDLTGGNMEDNIAIMERMNDTTGDSAKAFEEASKTAEFQFNQALANVKASAIELGNTLMPVATEIVDGVNQMVQWFSKLDDSTKRSVIQFALMASGLGVGLKAVSMFSGAISGLTNTFNFFIPKVISANKQLTRMDKIMNGTKIGLLIAGLTAAYVVYNKLSTSIRKAGEEKRVYNKLMTEASASAMAEMVNVKSLISVIEDETIAKDKRLDALKELRDINPKYFGDLDMEEGKVKGLTTAYDKFAEATLRQAKIRAVSAKIQEYVGQLVEAEATLERVKAGNTTLWEEFGTVGASEGVNALLTDAQKNVDDLTGKIDGLTDKLKELRGGPQTDGDGITVLPEVTVTADAADKVTELTEAQKAHIEAVKEVQQTLQSELNKANELYQIHGDVVQMNQEKQKALQSAIESLIDLGYKAGSAAVQEYVKQIRDLQVDTDKATGKLGELQEVAALKPAPIEFEADIPTPDELAPHVPILNGTIFYDAKMDKVGGVTQAGGAFKDLFSAINEKGGQIGEKLSENLVGGIDAAAMALDQFSQTWAAFSEMKQAQLDTEYQKELARIEGSSMATEKKEQARIELEKKYAAKQKELNKQVAVQKKAGAISQSIINTALAVSRALTEGAFAGPVLAGIIGAMGAAQTALIASTPLGFAKGGKVMKQSGKVSGVTNATPRTDGDHILAYVKAGEAILNQQQIAALGGPGILKAIGVPGFSGGGVAGVAKREAVSMPTIGSRAMRLHLTFNEPRWDGEDLVMGIKRVERTMSSHNAL